MNLLPDRYTSPESLRKRKRQNTVSVVSRSTNQLNKRQLRVIRQLQAAYRSLDAWDESLRLCVSACRACGRALGSAFREAQSMADAASARSLYFSIRELEKQLWVLDPRQAL